MVVIIVWGAKGLCNENSVLTICRCKRQNMLFSLHNPLAPHTIMTMLLPLCTKSCFASYICNDDWLYFAAVFTFVISITRYFNFAHTLLTLRTYQFHYSSFSACEFCMLLPLCTLIVFCLLHLQIESTLFSLHNPLAPHTIMTTKHDAVCPRVNLTKASAHWHSSMNRAEHCARLISFYCARRASDLFALKELLALMLRWLEIFIFQL